MLPTLTSATTDSQLAALDLKDLTGLQISLQSRQQLLRFLKTAMLSLRCRGDLHLAGHAKVSNTSASAVFLCYLLFHSVRPNMYITEAGPAECLTAQSQQMSAMLIGSCKKVAQALSCRAFYDSSAKLAQNMVYPDHIWDQRNFICCFHAMLEHIEMQLDARSGAWRIPAEHSPWGHWQATPAYVRHLKSNPLGVAGDVLGIMQSLGTPIHIY